MFELVQDRKSWCQLIKYWSNHIAGYKLSIECERQSSIGSWLEKFSANNKVCWCLSKRGECINLMMNRKMKLNHLVSTPKSSKLYGNAIFGNTRQRTSTLSWTADKKTEWKYYEQGKEIHDLWNLAIVANSSYILKALRVALVLMRLFAPCWWVGDGMVVGVDGGVFVEGTDGGVTPSFTLLRPSRISAVESW